MGQLVTVTQYELLLYVSALTNTNTHTHTLTLSQSLRLLKLNLKLCPILVEEQVIRLANTLSLAFLPSCGS